MNRLSPQPNVLTAGGMTEFSRGFWPVLLVASVLTGLVAGLLMKLLFLVQHVAYHYQSGSFADAVAATGGGHRIAVMLAAGLLAGLVGWWLRHAPGGRSGELTVALWFHAGRLSPLLVTVRSLLSIVIVGMGAALGREAAPKQMGALFSSMLASRAGLTPTERRLMVACGAGAGMACVYNVPLGGALFALEVLLGTLSLPLVVPALLMSGLATLVSWSLLPSRPTYEIAPSDATDGLLVFSLLVGPLAGLASVAYTRIIVWSDLLKPKGMMRTVAPVIGLGAVGVLATAFPLLLGNGKDVVQLALSGALPAAMLLALLALRPLATSLCLGSGAPGGLFTPTLTFGALLGAVLGHAWSMAWPGTLPGAYALVGAAAIMAGATLGPISSIVLVFELTRSSGPMLMPIILASGGATLVARRFDGRSIYSGRIHALREDLDAARDASSPVRVPSSATLAEIVQNLLRAGEGRRLEVIDDHAACVGEIGAGGALGARAADVIGATSAIVTASDLACATRTDRGRDE